LCRFSWKENVDLLLVSIGNDYFEKALTEEGLNENVDLLSLNNVGSKKFSLSYLAKMVNLSDFHFLRQFKKTFHTTPHEFVMKKRIDLAKRLFVHNGRSIKQVAILAGFSSSGHFARAFKEREGISPSDFTKTIH